MSVRDKTWRLSGRPGHRSRCALRVSTQASVAAIRCASNAINVKPDRMVTEALLYPKNLPKQHDCDLKIRLSTYSLPSPSRMQAALCPNHQHVWRGILGAQACGSQTTTCLAVGAPRAGLGNRPPRGGQRQRETAQAAEDRRPVFPSRTRFDGVSTCSGQEQSNVLDAAAAQQLGRFSALTRDIVSRQVTPR